MTMKQKLNDILLEIGETENLRVHETQEMTLKFIYLIR